MTDWTDDELDKIGSAEELQLASLRADGTLRKPVIIWVVRVGDGLYVRSVKGRESTWFHGVQTRYQGRVQAGGLERDVTLAEEPGEDLAARLDTVYAAKYRRYPSSVDHINSPAARQAALKLLPRR